MFVTYKELLGLPEMDEAEVFGGKEGLDRNIHWCHVFEMEKMKEWTTPNLLVFCTGVAYKENIEESLLIMVENLSKLRAAGLVLGIGEYISKVPESVVILANKLKFPVIGIPDKIKFVDITFKIANMIFEKQATINRQQILMENIISDPNNDYGAELEYYGFLRHISYRYVVIRKQGKGRVPEGATEAIGVCISKIREVTHRKIFMLNRMNQIILLVPDTNGIKMNQEYAFDKILCMIEKEVEKLDDCDSYSIAVSDWTADPSKLSQCYEQTQFLFSRGRNLFPEKRIFYYSDLGIFALVDVSKEEEAKKIIKNTLGEVAEDNELVESLHAYLTNHNSMQASADALYVHVNTMKYRMKKIEAMLPKGITKNDVFALEGAIYLRKYFNGFV